jgi:hypothetical protein
LNEIASCLELAGLIMNPEAPDVRGYFSMFHMQGRSLSRPLTVHSKPKPCISLLELSTSTTSPMAVGPLADLSAWQHVRDIHGGGMHELAIYNVLAVHSIASGVLVMNFNN